MRVFRRRLEYPMRKLLILALIVAAAFPITDVHAGTVPIIESNIPWSIGGRLHNHPRTQFGTQGDCSTDGPVAYLQRFAPGRHVHIGTDIAIPGNDARVTITMRLGRLPPLEGPYMQLFQGTPSDGVYPASVVELRIDQNRVLTTGLFQNRATIATLGIAPVGRWFTVTFEMQRVPVAKLRNPRQVLGGTDGTLAPFTEQVSAWSIVALNEGGG
jgi:hypothetical protein